VVFALHRIVPSSFMQAKLTLTRKVVHLEVAMNNHGGTLVRREADDSRSVDHELVVLIFLNGEVSRRTPMLHSFIAMALHFT
jgi:hypothetical protein